jgi:hypothetical protein
MEGGEFVVIALFCGLSAGTVAKIKGNSFLLWFLVGTVLPLLGTLAAVFSRSDRDEPERECPRCGRRLKLYVQVCPSCGTDLPFPDDEPVGGGVQGRQRPV